MSFVYASAFGFRWTRVLEDVFLLLGRIPEYSIVTWREINVLGDAGNPGWYSFYPFVRGWNDQRELYDDQGLTIRRERLRCTLTLVL